VTVGSKVHTVLDLSNTEIAGSNLARDLDVNSILFCDVLCRQRFCDRPRSTVKYKVAFIASEVDFVLDLIHDRRRSSEMLAVQF